MTPVPPVAAEAELVFSRSAHANLFGWLFLLGGIGAFLFAAMGFILAIVANVDQIAMHSITTMPAILGVGAFMAGWSMLSAPRQVVVGPKGLTITKSSGEVSYGWDQIAWAKVDAVLMGMRKALFLYGPDGRKVAQLGDAFNDFDHLVESVMRRTSGSEAAGRVQQMKGRQAAWICLGTGGVLLAVCAFLFYDSYEKARGETLLASQGVPGTATIERRFVAPNGVTHRIEYRINEQAGTRNVEVEQGYWHTLEGAAVVPVMYVPQEPQFSALLQGEVKSTDLMDSPAGGMGLAGVGSLLALFLLGVGIMQFCGWDIDLDSKTGKLSVQRFGAGR